MKVEILTENLKEGVNFVGRIPSKNLTLPVLENILIETENNFLSLSATDLETAIKWWILAKIQKKGKVLVSARFFTNFISLFSEEKILLEEKNQNLLIESKNYKTQIRGENPSDFPIIPEIKTKEFLEVNNKEFCLGLSQVVDITSFNQVRPEISGVYFSFLKNNLKIVATDSFRLAEKTISLVNTHQKEHSFILPQKAAKELISVLKEKEGKLKIYFSPNQVLFEFPMVEIKHPQTQIISRLIEGEYPDYQEIIPKKFKTRIILKKEIFLNQIKRASLFSGKINEIKFLIDPNKKIIEIVSQNPDIGEYKATLPAKIEGEKENISFNYKFLTDGLLNIKSPEIFFNISKEEGPCVLKPIDDETYIYVVMPIKTA